MQPHEQKALHELQARVALRRREDIALIKLWAYLEERQVTSDLGFTSPYTYLVQELKLMRREAYELTQLAQAYNRYPKAQVYFQEGHFIKETVLRLKKFLEPKIEWTKLEREDFFLKHMNMKLSELLEHQEFKSTRRGKISLLVEPQTIEGMNALKSRRGIERGLDEFLSWMLETVNVEFQKKRYQTKVARSVYDKAQGVCELCGNDYDLEIDHIQPRALGGSDAPVNMRLLCRRCNVRAFHRCHPLFL
jgi:hypothetical protein